MGWPRRAMSDTRMVTAPRWRSVGVGAFDESDTVRREVTTDRSQQRQPDLFGRVDERAHQEDAPKGAPEFKVLDSREDSLGAFDQLEHLGIEVDCDDAAAERDQRMRDPSGPRPELKDFGVVRNLAVDEFRLVSSREEPIQVDGRARVAHSRRVWQTAGWRASTCKADKVDQQLRRHPRDAAHYRSRLVEDAVAVGDRRDVVGDDRADEIAVLVEDEVARGVPALVDVADHRTRRGRELDADKPALPAEARRGDLDRLPVRHADEAEVRVHLDDDGLARLHQARELLGGLDVGRTRPHREPDRAEDDDIDGHRRPERGESEGANWREDDRDASDGRDRDREDEE